MPTYLDHAATTPIRPEVLTAYTQALTAVGNPSSVHKFGQDARNALEAARESLAESLSANRSEIIFTSGGTESDNLAVKGLYWQRNGEDSTRSVIITAGTEHHGVLDPVYWLADHQGAEVQLVPVDTRGVFDLDWLEAYLASNGSRVALISLMWVNNETGVIADMKSITAIAAAHGIPVHSDGVAALGHIPIDFASSGLAALSISAHKIGGPVGAGALLVGRSQKLTSLVHGGGQERGMRSGTMDSAGAAALALAARLSLGELDSETTRLAELAGRLIAAVHDIAPDAVFSRGDAVGLPGTAHFTFPGCSADSMIFLLDAAGVSVSAGSACTAGVNRPSHVLLAMGRTEDEATGALRISMGYTTTAVDIEAFSAAFPSVHAAAKKAGLPSK
ncbi:MAG: cysteine desulfurase family protein [Rhodoluna sp.]|nr:cysteine desulfurase family protein [Rhodoluna sp.]